MRKALPKLLAAACAAVILAGAVTALAPNAFAKPPKPPHCPNCAPTITLPDGRVCTLSACGSDCVYTCPF